ncbi:TetR family transcriptional regulator [Nonomuraea phyllanthi]|uniref:TetR family transcriptional regulator n=2 Tax=Nonomuraea phyllanthi TaxID=2219224 RepID=A0A5C4WP41_9ACTN|nr:TetR family transcriptional regulator [Nonomuraea phyllanthi]
MMRTFECWQYRLAHEQLECEGAVMARLTRAQQQERTRAAVLAAARQEFAERGYADAKIDRIAERAELTRGAVYSNFPSKRALYLAVLVAAIEQPSPAGAPATTGAAEAPGQATAPDAARAPATSGEPPHSSIATRPGAPGEPPRPGTATNLGTSGEPPHPGTATRPGTSSEPPHPGTATRPGASGGPSLPDAGAGLGAFARVWLERLPLSGDTPASGKLQARSLAGVFDDEPGRTALGQVARLEALLLGLALEAGLPRHERRVRLAELALTLLNGAGHLAETAPGYGDPFDVVRACRHLAGLDLADTWDPPYLPFVSPARSVADPWEPPAETPDLISRRPAELGADGVIAVLGAARLEAAEEAVRAARPGDRITVAVVTGDPAEIGRLVRLKVGDLASCLRLVFAPDAWPGLQLVIDEDAAVASAAGIPHAGDTTEGAVRVRDGRIVARAVGRGAAHAATTAGGRTGSVPGHAERDA